MAIEFERDPIDWDINPDPICLLCGVEVKEMIYSQPVNPTRSDVLFREKKWKHYAKARLEHVMVPSKEVEEVDFAKYPSMWSCMCRAIIKEPTTKYFLSGITALEVKYSYPERLPRSPYMVPKNPSMARIGGRTRNLQYDDTFIPFYPASVRRQLGRFRGKNIGFVVHAHCWALLNHIISTTLVESKMDKFVRAARKYWHDHEAWGGLDYMLMEWKLRLGPRHPGFYYGCDIYKNPFVVPEVQKAIDSARKTKKERVKSRCSDVPLEVAIMIAEWTCPIHYTPADVNNTRNLLSAWQWTLPDGFWKSRLKEEIFVELNPLRESDYSIDWQALRLDLMGLVSDQEWYSSSGLPNRERVLGFMSAIKSIFLEMR